MGRRASNPSCPPSPARSLRRQPFSASLSRLFQRNRAGTASIPAPAHPPQHPSSPLRIGERQRKEKQQVSGPPTKSPPNQTRGEMYFKCRRMARAGRRFPIPVGTYSEYPRFKRTCTPVQVRAQRLFFWTVHCAAVGGCAAYGCGIPPAGAARFLFGKTKRKWGVDCQAINIAYIHPIGRPPASHGDQKNQFSTYETENFTDPNPGVIQKRSEPIWRLESIIPPRSGG